MCDRYTGKIVGVLIRKFIHSFFWVFNFILSACRTNFAKVAIKI